MCKIQNKGEIRKFPYLVDINICHIEQKVLANKYSRFNLVIDATYHFNSLKKQKSKYWGFNRAKSKAIKVKIRLN